MKDGIQECTAVFRKLNKLVDAISRLFWASRQFFWSLLCLVWASFRLLGWFETLLGISALLLAISSSYHLVFMFGDRKPSVFGQIQGLLKPLSCLLPELKLFSSRMEWCIFLWSTLYLQELPIWWDILFLFIIFCILIMILDAKWRVLYHR